MQSGLSSDSSAGEPATRRALLLLPQRRPHLAPTTRHLPRRRARQHLQQQPFPTTRPPPSRRRWLWPPGHRRPSRLINVVRAESGLPPLVDNETLAQAAQGQANDCSQRGWCSHTGSDGSDIKTRVRAVGYAGRGWAECWAQRKSPQGAVDVWMDEIPPNDPHRRTLLSTWLTEIGMGVAEAEWGYYYFIADFGRP